MDIDSFEIEHLIDSSTYYTKGHVDANEFREEIAGQFGIDRAALDDCRVVHCLARFVPLLPHQRNSFNFDYFVYFDQEKGRGAFSMTYADV